MSAFLLGNGFRADMGTCVRKLVLLKLIDACEDDGTRIFPAIATVAGAAQCSTRQVQREIRAFVDTGLLKLVREGGKGRRSTNEYAMDLDVLSAISRDGWKAFVEARGLKGDTVSPLEDDAKGDTSDTVRVTPETPKGDSWSRTTPPDSSLDPSDERESAREADRDQDGDGDAAEPVDEYGLTEGVRKALYRRLWAVAKRYVGSIADPISKSEPIWYAMAEDKRERAEKHVETFCATFKRGLRRPPLHEYLGEEKFDFLDVSAAGATTTATGYVHFELLAQGWWALLWRDFRAGRMLQVSARLAPATMARGTSVKSGDAPDDAELAGLYRAGSNSPQFEAWAAHVEAVFRERKMAARLPKPDRAPYVWLPSEWPPKARGEAALSEADEAMR